MTAGHTSATIGSNAIYNGSTVGKLNSKTLGGTVDGAFVKCDVGYVPTKKLINNDTTYSTCLVDPASFIVGLYLEKYGVATNYTTGRITSLTYSVPINGVAMTLVKADYPSASGDSGGPIAYWRYAGSASATRHVAGLHSASAKVNGVFSFSLFSRVDSIFSSLGLSNY